MTRRKLGPKIEKKMERNQEGNFFKNSGPGKKQPNLVKDQTVVITNILLSKCENQHCLNFFKRMTSI